MPAHGFWWMPTGLQNADFLLCPSMAEEELARTLPLLIRAEIPFVKAPSSWPEHLPKSRPSITITLRSGIQLRNLRGGHRYAVRTNYASHLCLQTITVFPFISVNIETVRRVILPPTPLARLNTSLSEIVIVEPRVSHSFRHCRHGDKQTWFDSCLHKGKQDLHHI